MNNLLNHAQDLAEAGEYDDAYRIANKCLKNEPNNSQWLNVMAHLMLETDKPSLAYQLARRVCDLAPKDSVGWLNLGVACREMRLDDEALRHFRRSLKYAQTPDKASMAHVNLASSLIDIGEFREAEPHCLKAIEQNPESKKAVMNLAFCQMAQCNWSEGWKNYREVIGHDWRPRFQYNNEPLWDGKSKGTIVLYGEQGLGDQICFLSMLPDVVAWADQNESRIILDIDRRLVSVVQRSFPDVEVYGTLGLNQLPWDASDVDYSLPIGQLGEYFRTDNGSYPKTAFLSPDPSRETMWRLFFESKKKPVIGIAWTGGVWITGSKFRTLKLDDLLPLFERIDAHWVSLEYKPAGKEVQAFREKHGIDIADYPYATLTKDYDDTMSMVAALDAVVGVPTTVIHAAGALGVRTITMSSPHNCWKYESGLLFHPTTAIIKNHGWTETIEETASYLEDLCIESLSASTQDSRLPTTLHNSRLSEMPASQSR